MSRNPSLDPQPREEKKRKKGKKVSPPDMLPDADGTDGTGSDMVVSARIKYTLPLFLLVTLNLAVVQLHNVWRRFTCPA